MSSKSTAAAGPSFSDDKRLSELRAMTGEIDDLRAALRLLSWDQNTSMPEGAGAGRGEQMATLQGLVHDRWTTQRLGELLSELAAPSQKAPFTDADRALLREVNRERVYATRLPRGLVEEMARVETLSFEAWHKAR
ncbi:MAG: carboxypeptidase M32, partial [Ktedonobacterales bacterium]